jgi:hypothetical protein
MRIATLMAGATLALGMMAAAAPTNASPRLPLMSSAAPIVVQARDDDDDHRLNRHRQFQNEVRRDDEHEHEGRRFRRHGC